MQITATDIQQLNSGLLCREENIKQISHTLCIIHEIKKITFFSFVPGRPGTPGTPGSPISPGMLQGSTWPGSSHIQVSIHTY